MIIDGGTVRDVWPVQEQRLEMNITKTEVARFFRGTQGKVTTDALVKAFGVDKPGKSLRLTNVLSKLEDEGVIVKFPNNVYQHASHIHEAAETDEKVN